MKSDVQDVSLWYNRQVQEKSSFKYSDEEEMIMVIKFNI